MIPAISHTSSYSGGEISQLVPEPLKANRVLYTLYLTRGLSYRNEDHKTLLHLAAEMNDEGWVDFLLEKGADPLAEASDGKTPLYVAARGDHQNVLHKLTETIRQSGKTSRGRAHHEAARAMTLIDSASSVSVSEISRLFIEQAKLFINEENKDGNTPLHLAVMRNDVALVSDLIARGAIVKRNREGYTPIDLAAIAGNTAMLKAFVRLKMPMNDATDSGKTPVELACENGHDKSCAYLLSFLKLKRENLPNNIIQDVVIHNLPESALILAENSTPEGNSVLHFAVMLGNVALANKLFEMYKGIIMRNKDGYSPIDLAAMSGNTEMLKLFASYDNVMNQPGPSGKTPLELSCENGHDDCSAFLIANLRLKSEIFPRAILEIVLQKNLQKTAVEILGFLTERSLDRELKFFFNLACCLNATEMAKLIIEHAPEPKYSLAEALFLITSYDNVEIIRALYDKHPSLLSKALEGSFGFNSVAYYLKSEKILAYCTSIGLHSPDEDISDLTFAVKNLCAIFGTTGELSYADKTIDLEYWLALPVYDIASKIIPSTAPLLAEAFSEAAAASRSPESIIAAIDSGKLTVIPTGWSQHGCSVVIQDNIMIVCNRGQRRPGTPILAAYVIDPAKITPSMIKEIMYYSFKEREPAERFLYKELPSALSCLTAAAGEECAHVQALLDTIQPKEQHAGNCSAASVKAAIRAALFLVEYRKNPATAAASLASIKGKSKEVTDAMRKEAVLLIDALAKAKPKYAKIISDLLSGIAKVPKG